MRTIVTVCIGNICRSPMAQGLMREALPEIQVESAGIGALIGSPAAEEAVDLMRERGIDLKAHVARQISLDICRRADVILVMDVHQKEFLVKNYPFTQGKVFRIADNLKADVPDPYRKGVSAFVESLELIDAGVKSWVKRINKINEYERQSK